MAISIAPSLAPGGHGHEEAEPELLTRPDLEVADLTDGHRLATHPQLEEVVDGLQLRPLVPLHGPELVGREPAIAIPIIRMQQEPTEQGIE